MEGLLENATVILVLVLAVILWILYHQLFHVVYFGNGFNAMFREFLVCFIIALLAVGFVGKFFLGAIAAIGNALGVVGTLLLWLIKIALVILAILVVIAIISSILEHLGIIKSESKGNDQPDEGETVSDHSQNKPE